MSSRPATPIAAFKSLPSNFGILSAPGSERRNGSIPPPCRCSMRGRRSRSATGTVGEVHEVAGSFAVLLVLESDVGIGSAAEHVHQRPQGEAIAPVLLQPEIDPHPLQPGRD